MIDALDVEHDVKQPTIRECTKWLGSLVCDYYPNIDSVLVGTTVMYLLQAKAAPQMLEALKFAREAISMGPLEIAASYGPDAHPDEALIDAARKIEAAIAAAEGK